MKKSFFLLSVLSTVLAVHAQQWEDRIDLLKNGNSFASWKFLDSYSATDSTISADAAAGAIRSGCAIQYKSEKKIEGVGFVIDKSDKQRKVTYDQGNKQLYPEADWSKTDSKKDFNLYFLFAVLNIVFAIAYRVHGSKRKDKARLKRFDFFVFVSMSLSLLACYYFWPENPLSSIPALMIGTIIGISAYQISIRPKLKEMVIAFFKNLFFWLILAVPVIIFGNRDSWWFLPLVALATFLLTTLAMVINTKADERIAKKRAAANTSAGAAGTT